MANIQMRGLDEYTRALSRLDLIARDRVCGKAIYEGAGMVADAVKSAILSVPTTSVLTTKDASWNVYDDSQQVPYVSVGGIVKKKVDGVIKWAAFVLEKVQFTTPGLEATTQGKTIEWKTPSLTANILRSDADGHPWFRISSFLDTEADGETLVKDYLGITGQQEDTE